MSMLNRMAQRTFENTPPVDGETLCTRRRPIELQTENNFSIVRRCDVDEQDSQTDVEHCFVVRDPFGYELEITVSFSENAIADAIRQSNVRLMFPSAYWLTCAERHLADYLWEHDAYPPTARIIIDRLSPDDIDLLRRCGVDAGDESRGGLSRDRVKHDGKNSF